MYDDPLSCPRPSCSPKTNPNTPGCLTSPKNAPRKAYFPPVVVCGEDASAAIRAGLGVITLLFGHSFIPDADDDDSGPRQGLTIHGDPFPFNGGHSFWISGTGLEAIHNTTILFFLSLVIVVIICYGCCYKHSELI